jgi:hypothetical protein
LLLHGLIVASLAGAAVTSLFRIETKGVDLDHIGEATGEPSASKAIAWGLVIRAVRRGERY